MIIPLGLAAFVVYFLVFYAYIKIFKMPIPGSGEIAQVAKKIVNSAKNLVPRKDIENEFYVMSQAILKAVGGKENVKSVEHCVTRLRLIVNDANKVDDDAIVASGASGVVKPSKNACQVVCGTKVQFVFEEFEKLVQSKEE